MDQGHFVAESQEAGSNLSLKYRKNPESLVFTMEILSLM